MYRSFVTRKYLQRWGIRLYQSSSETGVYGYRPKSKTDYKISQDVVQSRINQSNVYRWVEAYRTHAHRIANVNPVALELPNESIPELDRQRYGLSDTHEVKLQGIIATDDHVASVKRVEEFLRATYCGAVSAEFSFIKSEHEREWLSENYERTMHQRLTDDAKKEIADLLIRSQAWDNFLATKFPSVKRYGAEGAESMMAFFRQIFQLSVDDGIEHIVLGMPHRGKLNLLTTMLQTRPAKIFNKFKGRPEFPADAKAMCDIASHFHASEDLDIDGKKIRVSMLHNSSHLEAINPASMGKTRSKQQKLLDGAFNADHSAPFAATALNIQLHGDAAFAGQGINQEMLMMAGTPHFDVGGSIHMIVNNQIGFTTPSDRGRVTAYSSDLAKSIMAPVFHVNGDDPEVLTLVTKVAYDYQRKFRKDIFIDLNCFRRWGHNEVDDPTFTNPLLYGIIHARDSVPNIYARKLVETGVLTTSDVTNISTEYHKHLNDELANLENYQPDAYYFKKQWAGIQQAPSAITYWDTGLDYDLLRYIGEQSVHIPDGFNVHPHLLKTHVTTRRKRLDEGIKIDWATAEAMAIGSLMYQGHNVRLSGEDVGRGTFSHRHAMLVDNKTNEMFIPLNTLDVPGDKGGKLEVANSILSEEAVLSFEYGMALDNPHNLIIWEAQFGDFFNGAQIIIDAFIASGETKWMYSNGMVILLPHGYDGAASEHSSCRMERFLQLTDSKETVPDGDDINMQVINPTTAAQYFHALRRQLVRNFRKPLVVVAPKILLRLSDAASTYSEFGPGQTFMPVLGDTTVADATRVKKVILCSGKHYYNLSAERRERKVLDEVAIVRLESLCPFPVMEINKELEKYKNAKVWVWSQEEHRNMGAWSFVQPRFENMCGRKIKYCGRNEAATPAVGVSAWHKLEVVAVVSDPFELK